MKKILKIAYAALCLAVIFNASAACGEKEAYYEEKYPNPLENVNVGGRDSLTLAETSETITLENAKARIVLSAESGAITEYVNKQSKLWLVKDGEGSTPLKLFRKNDSSESYTLFKERTVKDDDAEKEVELCWQYADGLEIRSAISLSKDADEAVFRLSLSGNRAENYVVSVEYPVIEGIDTLYERENDYFVSPVAMGYLFENPLKNFNSTVFAGIGRDDGMYPSGWNVSMQFEGYYSAGLGGFMLWSRDGGSTIKSFTCTGMAGKLRMSMHHYPDTISDVDYAFDYDIAIGNLTQGSWQECAEKYRTWAAGQKWCEKGPAKDRTDINKSLYEETALVNFGFPYTGKLTMTEQEALYDKMKSRIDGKMLNILFNKSDYAVELTKKNDDLLSFFEFNTFSVKNAASGEANRNIIKDMYGSDERYGQIVNGIQYYYQCPASEKRRAEALAAEEDLYERFSVDGFYHDCGISGVHPNQCYNTGHGHGTRVNIIEDAIKQISEAKAYATEKGIYSVGEELIFEQLLPYVDYYQARANGGVMSWMEHTRFTPTAENNGARNIPLFDYVYGQYGALRMDGYLSADILLGDGYYYVAALTALNGGLVEYNYEFLNQNEYLHAEETDDEMLGFIGELGRARRTYGKDWLVYGKMMKAPAVGSEKSSYDYYNKNYNNGAGLRGTIVTENVVVSAYEANGRIAVFLCNVTDKAADVKFVLNALREYGISEGKVSVVYGGNENKTFMIDGGKAKIALKLPSRKVVMLEIEESV